MSLDDTAAYVEAFGESVTLAGAAKSGIYSEAGEVVLDGIVTVSPTFVAETSAIPAAVPGQALVRGAATYLVRQVLKLPPDGAMTQLVLARS
jgi:hypothetical protein